MVRVVFVRSTGERIVADGHVGQSLLQLAQEYELPLEGACEGNMACSTCHLIVAQDWFSRLGEISDEEDDMLDLAAGVTATSRLGCQIRLTDDMDGLTLHVPAVSNSLLGF